MQRQLSVLIAFGLILPGCGHNGESAVGPKAPVVRFSMPVEREVTDYEYFTGRTDAVKNVQVRARVTGYLDKVNFKAGSDVVKDDVLFVIDPRPYKAALDRSVAQIALAEAKLKLATVELARGLSIAKTPGAISQTDLDKAAADKSSAEATLQAAKAEAESADLNLKFTSVLSPIDGRIDREFITPGNLVTQDSTLLTTIVSMDPMYAYFDIDERTMLRIQKLIREGKVKSIKDGHKTPVQFGLANDGQMYPHEGELDFVKNQVDASTGTLQVRALIANPTPPDSNARLLTPGLFLRVRVPIGPPHQAILVPQAAVGTDQGKKFVYVVNDKNVVEYRPIQLGPLQSNGMQIVEPFSIVRNKDGVRVVNPGEAGEPSLVATDRVIVGGLQRVRSGMTVDPKSADDARK
jgi:multidrug efflux system membrane fusion protein